MIVTNGVLNKHFQQFFLDYLNLVSIFCIYNKSEMLKGVPQKGAPLKWGTARHDTSEKFVLFPIKKIREIEVKKFN